MRILIIALAMSIVGCSTISRQPIQLDPQQVIETWNMSGRLAAKIDNQGGSASFIWQRDINDHNIELYGPLGSGRVFLEESNGQASLTDKDSQLRGATLQEVLYRRIGWLIPFDEMQQWVIGKPYLDQISDQIYQDDRLVGFTQAGWQVNYDKFETISGTDLPVKITITALDTYLDDLSIQLGQAVETVRVKFIIKQFSNG